MKRFFIILIVWLCTLNGTFAQERQNWKDIFGTATFFFEEDEYEEALYNYQLLYEIDSTNPDVNFRIGMCYMAMPGEEVKAIPYLERSLDSIDLDYKEYSPSNEGAPLHTLFFLGKAYRLSNQLDKAIQVIDQFKSSPYYVQYNASVVEREIQTIHRAKMLQDKPLQLTFSRFSDLISNQYPALHPVLSGDGKTLIFLQQLQFYDAIMMLEKVDEQWVEPVNISAQVQSDGVFYPVSLSYDGQELYLVKELYKGRSDLYVSQREEDGWSIALPLSLNSRKVENGASISADGKALYFSSNRRWGNTMNIFVSHRNSISDNWSRPVHLRKPVNSKLNEISPELCLDGQYLFFSSQGHYNMGGYDIFFVKKQETGEWGFPVNLGYPLSTTNDNTYYFPLDRYTGLISMQRGDDKAPTIYRVMIEP